MQQNDEFKRGGAWKCVFVCVGIGSMLYPSCRWQLSLVPLSLCPMELSECPRDITLGRLYTAIILYVLVKYKLERLFPAEILEYRMEISPT